MVERALAFTVPSERLVPAVDRAARILEALGRSGRDWSLAELASELEVQQGSARDILQTLRHHGLVERDVTTGRYRLGLGFARLARIALDRVDVRRVAHPYVAELAGRVEETVLLTVRDDHHIVIADVVEPHHDLHVSMSIGQRLPLTAGSVGKAFLSSPRELEKFLERGGSLAPYTPKSQTDVDVYEAELAVVRARGLALDDEEYLPGVRSASALITGPLGEPAGALTIVGYCTRITLSRLEELGEVCRATADAIAEQLGSAGPG